MERVMGFEPTTSSLGRKHSTAELHPQQLLSYHLLPLRFKGFDARAICATLIVDGQKYY